jgi:hypothetical protein
MFMQFLSVFFISLAMWALFYDYVTRSGDSILLLGEVWYDLSAASLNLTQAIIERYIWPPLWGDVVLPLLQMPFWLVCVGLSLFFALLWLINRRRTNF